MFQGDREDVIETRERKNCQKYRQRMFKMKFKPKKIPVARSPEIQGAATQVFARVLVEDLT